MNEIIFHGNGSTVANMFADYSDVVTVKELCRMLKIGKNTAYDLLKSGKLSSVKIGAKYLIPKIYILTYLHIQSGLQVND